MNVVLSVLLLILFVIAVGKLTGRLLGIRLGNLRGAIVGLIGWVAGLLAAIYIVGEASGSWRRIDVETAGDGISVIAIVLVFGVLAAMPVAIVIDLITRTGPPHGPRRRRRRLLHPIRAARAALAPYGRLRELVANARRENLLHFRYASRSALESPDLSRRLRAVLEDSGGMLVKLGQIASTRTDVLPAATTDELAKLRADVRKVPEAEVREMLETELGEPVERAFGSFEFEPLAAASIGQTHRAVLADGTPVVVKVQRPGIDEVVARDAAVLRLATSQLERRVEAARAIRLGDFSEELIAGLEEELDYLHEGAVGTRLRENRAHDAGIAVPRVHASLSTARVLVMEQVVARPIVDPEALGASPVPRDELARRLLASFIGQVLDDGLFHADPHPGNLLLDDAGHDLDARLRLGRATRRARARRPARDRARRRHGRARDPGARRADARRRRRLRRPARARDRHERAARRARRARRPRPARDRRGARGHAAPRHAPAVVDHAAGPRADHARGHAARRSTRASASSRRAARSS